MRAIRGLWRDGTAVVLTGLRLAGVHAPTLLVIYLFGSAARHGVLWASVALSEHHATLAGFLLPLAPMSTLTAIILMLRVVSTSLSSASFATDGVDGADGAERGRTGPLLSLLASTLIPFLTVYAAQGYLKEDIQRFVNAATYDEIFGSAGAFYGERADAGRAAFAEGTLLVGIVAVALVLRFAISRLDLPSRHVTFGIVAAYVEVVWLFIIARQVTLYQDRAWDWVRDRRFVDWINDVWSRLIDAVGPIGAPLQSIADGIGNVIGDADAVLLIPIAWLTVGAVALGRTVSVVEPERREARWQRPLQRVPAPVRRVGAEATADMRSRFRGLADGIRLLAVGGLLPMLMFCLVFVVARQAGTFVLELGRLVVGPLSRDDALAFLPYVGILSGAVYSLLLVGLLAAAVDRVISTHDRRTAASAAAQTPARASADRE